MELKLGEKIKELRKRDGRTQEDLANALGVTAQAVSRWESNGGYPDMSMIPAIANYFHISIDILFGYNNDREIKIQEYVKAVNRLLLENNCSVDECIELMRKALEEFPSEPQLQMFLALALSAKGNKASLEEAVTLYEHLSEQNKEAIFPLISLYIKMKEYEKAEKKALEQPAIRISREVLLSQLDDDKKGAKYRGEAILTLLHELRMAIEIGITKNEVLKNSKEGIEIFLLVRQLYEKLIDEEYCGYMNSDLCTLDLCCARIAANVKDYNLALTFFDSAYEQYIKHLCHWEKWRNTQQVVEETFTHPLLSEVKNISIYLIVCRPEFFTATISSFPDDIKAQIINNPKYAELFE